MTVPPYEMLRRFWPIYVWMFERLLVLEQLFPTARLTSWYRDRATNQQVGGDFRSQHLLAFAVDVAVFEEDKERFAEIARGLGWYPVVEYSHVHLQTFPARSLPEEIFREL